MPDTHDLSAGPTKKQITIEDKLLVRGREAAARSSLGFFVLLPENPDHGSENADAPFALLDLAAELVPRIVASCRVASGFCRAISRVLPKLQL